ncbi:MAG: relaxase/mobilization nuclease domain-containing protein [Thiohalocapsa sp.]
MSARSIDDDFVFILPQMRAAKGPISVERRRSLILQAIHGNPHGTHGGKGREAPQVMLKITSFSSSAQKLAAHLDYISRNGDNEVFDRYGNRFSHLSAASENADAREAIQLYGRELATASETPYKKKGGARSRVSMNMMLSMPAGTDKTAFELAVGDFLNREYGAFDYVYTFHDDRDHYHAHVVVGLLGSDGRWLNPRKHDIAQWRQSFAESLQGHGIAARATPSYSRGKPKAGYRRDLAETEKRGTRRVPRPAPTYDAEKEKDAIEKRAQAWTRIATHYRESGEVAAAEQISGFVADSFSGREAPDRATPSGRGGRGR